MTERKTVLITGCSAGGIGEALALAFHRKGHYVIATARDLSKAHALKNSGNFVIKMDVCVPSSIQSAVRAVTEADDSRLDILVNDAGIGKGS